MRANQKPEERARQTANNTYSFRTVQVQELIIAVLVLEQPRQAAG